MATGGEEFGNEKTPLLENTDDQDDGDAGPRGDQTTEFEPGASSTPAPNGTQRQTTMNRPGEEPSYVLPGPHGLSTTMFTAERELDIEFPHADKAKLKYFMDEKEMVKVGMIKPGKTSYRLLTEIPGKKGKYQINKKLPKEIKEALGESRRETIGKKMEILRRNISENQKIIDDPFENRIEKNKAHERMKREKQELTSLEKELDQLINRNYQPSESIELETFQTNDAVREERYQEKERQKEEKNEIANDKNRSSAERESARKDAEEIQQEQNEILNEREREIEQLPLRDRLREKVKAIFKKYGFTVGAVFLAVGTTLGVLLSSLSNGLKAVSKGVGNGLKTLGKKISEILPGLIGAVVSFVFRTAGNVVGFLGKHAWLLILAVAAFLFERVMKRRG